jgi:hypothetical protein
MITVIKKTNDTYTLEDLNPTDIVTLYKINETDYSLDLVGTIPTTIGASGAFGSGFGGDFDRFTASTAEFTVTDEGLYLISTDVSLDQRIVYNFTTVQNCSMYEVETLFCCSSNYYKKYSILLSTVLLFNKLDALALINVYTYVAGTTRVDDLRYIITVKDRLILYCNGCESKISCCC